MFVLQTYNEPVLEPPMPSNPVDRRAFLQGAAAVALTTARPARAADASELKPIQAEIEKRHDEAVHRLQEWIWLIC